MKSAGKGRSNVDSAYASMGKDDSPLPINSSRSDVVTGTASSKHQDDDCCSVHEGVLDLITTCGVHSRTIGKGGGSLTGLYGVTIRVPEGAVDEDTVLSMQYSTFTSSAHASGDISITPVIHVEPHIVFKKNITVKMPHSLNLTEGTPPIRILFEHDGKEDRVVAPCVVDASSLTFETNQFCNVGALANADQNPLFIDAYVAFYYQVANDTNRYTTMRFVYHPKSFGGEFTELTNGFTKKYGETLKLPKTTKKLHISYTDDDDANAIAREKTYDVHGVLDGTYPNIHFHEFTLKKESYDIALSVFNPEKQPPMFNLAYTRPGPQAQEQAHAPMQTPNNGKHPRNDSASDSQQASKRQRGHPTAAASTRQAGPAGHQQAHPPPPPSADGVADGDIPLDSRHLKLPTFAYSSGITQ